MQDDLPNPPESPENNSSTGWFLALVILLPVLFGLMIASIQWSHTRVTTSRAAEPVPKPVESSSPPAAPPVAPQPAAPSPEPTAKAPEEAAPAAPEPAPAPEPEPEPAPAVQPVATGDVDLGGKLVMKSDCIACHRLDIKLVGPSYQDIANRYKSDPEAQSKLAGKVKSGGSGSWGPIPMAPHPTLSATDIASMVSWILAQKTDAAAPVAVAAPTPVVLPVAKPIVFAKPENIPAFEEPRRVVAPLAALPAQEVDAKKAELGRFLFFDSRLSGDTTVSCATCHDPAKGFGDGLALSEGYPGALYFRNAPTLINSTLQKRFMWDGRLDGSDITTLCRDMITESHTMNMDSRLMQERLKQVPEYLEMWRGLFGEGSDPYGPKLYGVVGEFVKTIRTKNAPIDLFLNGNGDALDESAKRGLQLFSGKASCIQCHNGALMSDGDLHATGVPEHPEVLKEPLRTITMLRHYATQGVPGYMNRRSDIGHYVVTKREADLGKFKTAPLRDLKYTAPYMHNGVFDTLVEVVDFYDRGGGEIPNKDPLLKPLKLSVEEKMDLLAFLEALSGDPTEVVRPDSLPEYQLIETSKN